MSTMTIHALDNSIEKRIRDKARRNGRSLNQTLKELLAASVGATAQPAADNRADFAEFCGIWTKKDAQDFRNAASDLNKVDREDWL